MLSRFLSSRVFALAQVFSGVHQIFVRLFVAGVRGNACHSSRVMCGNARPACLVMRAHFLKTAQVGVDLAHFRRNGADNGETLRQ